MNRGTFAAALFGKAVVPTITLPPNDVRAHVYRAIMHDSQRIRCGALIVCDSTPVLTLMRLLKDSGRPDGWLIISWPDGAPAMTVKDFYSFATANEKTQ